ncbi:MAG: hypothetical protein CMQ11_17255 [Gammaproteobacteria bacterium]|nr:hypothetical protein [Gammaproteobacteria bacterium]
MSDMHHVWGGGAAMKSGIYPARCLAERQHRVCLPGSLQIAEQGTFGLLRIVFPLEIRPPGPSNVTTDQSITNCSLLSAKSAVPAGDP